MISGGDNLVVQKEHGQQPFWVDVDLVSGGGTLLTKTARSTNHQIYIQKIVLSIHTHANTKVFTVTASAGAPANIAAHTDLTAAAGVPSVVEWDFGPHGVALAAGASMVVATTATSSMVGVAHIEGFQRLAVPVAVASTN
jgi:hypothetical protein